MIVASVVQKFIFSGPQLFRQCHASTLTQAPDGTLLAAWFGGTAEGTNDVGIWLSRLDLGEEHWSSPKLAADHPKLPLWNPVLFTDSEARVHLFFKLGTPIARWQTMHIWSADQGRTWSAPQELVPGDRGGRGPVRSRPLLLPTGEWLAPASSEDGLWRCFVDRSADNGKSWNRSLDIHPTEQLPGEGMIQPTLWYGGQRNIHMLIRTSAGRIYRSDSDNLGATWNPAYSTGLPNNNSGLDVGRLKDGTLLLVHNPVAENWGPRTPLVVQVSPDNGLTWELLCTLVDQPGEYSYPTILIDEHDHIWISATWNRQQIVVWQLKLDPL